MLKLDTTHSWWWLAPLAQLLWTPTAFLHSVLLLYCNQWVWYRPDLVEGLGMGMGMGIYASEKGHIWL